VHMLNGALFEILSSPGVIGTSLVDAVTGMTYGSAGDTTGLGDGADLSDLAILITDRLHEAGATGELESVIVTTAHRHHVIQVVPRQGDPVLLATTLDRGQTNLALAARQLAGHAKGVLA
jgi:hypothetical protein